MCPICVPVSPARGVEFTQVHCFYICPELAVFLPLTYSILPEIEDRRCKLRYMAIEEEEQNRTVFILTVRDRTVSQAIAQVLTAHLESSFHCASYAYRVGRSAVDATRDLHEVLMKNPASYVLRCDVHHFFDEVSHKILLHFLNWSLPENELTIQLISQVQDQPWLFQGQLQKPTKGICQGSPLSPLLSNLYLTPLDRYIEKRGFRHFRFSDDIAIVLNSQSQGETLYQDLADFLYNQLRLKWHPDKKAILSFEQGFEFLGFHLSPQGRFPGSIARERLLSRLQAASDESERATAIQHWEAYYGRGTAQDIARQVQAIDRQDSGVSADSQKQASTQESQIPRVVSLMLDLFQGNPNCFARAWRSAERYGYAPVNCPISQTDIIDHIMGKQSLGIYLLNQGNVRFTCLDLDLDHTVMNTCYHNDSASFTMHQNRLFQYARKIQNTLRNLNFDPLLEDSGYKGFHVWLFWNEPVPAADVISFWRKILEISGNHPPQTNCEIFPRESVPTGGPGSLIKLPLAIHPNTRGRSMFLDDCGHPVPNPEALLSNVKKATAPMLKSVLYSKTEPKPDQTPLDRLWNGCPVVRYLCQKAEQTHHLGHFERVILLYTVGQLGDEGTDCLHQIIGRCENYDRNYTQRQIEKKHPAPMGCRTIQEIMGDSLNQVECRCVFPEIPKGGYASPILHVYPNATKNLARKIPKR